MLIVQFVTWLEYFFRCFFCSQHIHADTFNQPNAAATLWVCHIVSVRSRVTPACHQPFEPYANSAVRMHACALSWDKHAHFNTFYLRCCVCGCVCGILPAASIVLAHQTKPERVADAPHACHARYANAVALQMRSGRQRDERTIGALRCAAGGDVPRIKRFRYAIATSTLPSSSLRVIFHVCVPFREYWTLSNDSGSS